MDKEDTATRKALTPGESELGHLTKDRIKAPSKRKPSKELLNSHRRNSILENSETFVDFEDWNKNSKEKTILPQETQNVRKTPPPVPRKPPKVGIAGANQLTNIDGRSGSADVSHSNGHKEPNEVQKGEEFTYDSRYGMHKEFLVDDTHVNMAKSSNLTNSRKQPMDTSNGLKQMSFTERLKASSLSSTTDYTRKFSPGASLTARLNASTITPARRNKNPTISGSNKSTQSTVATSNAEISQSIQGISRIASRDSGPFNAGYMKPKPEINNEMAPKNKEGLIGIDCEVDTETEEVECILKHHPVGDDHNEMDISIENMSNEHNRENLLPGSNDHESQTLNANVPCDESRNSLSTTNIDSPDADFSLPPLTSLEPLSSDYDFDAPVLDHFKETALFVDPPQFDSESEDEDLPIEIDDSSYSTKISELKLPCPPVIANDLQNSTKEEILIPPPMLTSSSDSEASTQGISSYLPSASKYGPTLTVDNKARSKKRKDSDGLNLPLVPPLDFPGKELNDEDISREFSLVPPPPPDFDSDNEGIDEKDVIDPPTLYVDSNSDDGSDLMCNLPMDDPVADDTEPVTSMPTVIQKTVKDSDVDYEFKMMNDELRPIIDPINVNMPLTGEALQANQTWEDNTPLTLPAISATVSCQEEVIPTNILPNDSKTGPQGSTGDYSTEIEQESNDATSFEGSFFSKKEEDVNTLARLGDLNDSDCDTYSLESSTSFPQGESPVREAPLPGRWSSFSSTSSTELPKKDNLVSVRDKLRAYSNSLDADSEPEEKYDDHAPTPILVRSKEDDHVNDKEDNFECMEDRLANCPVEQWTINDVGDWLEIIGIGDLRRTFAKRRIDGCKLLEIDLQLLDEMQINDPEDRELVLSQIYALKTLDEGDVETSLLASMDMLDALDNTSGVEHEKVLALLEALKSPASEAFMQSYLPSSPSPCVSPREEETRQMTPKLVHTKAATIESKSVVKRERSNSHETPHSKAGKHRPPRPKSEIGFAEARRKFKLEDGQSSADIPDESKDEKKNKKRRKFLPDAFSFRRKKASKLTKIFKSNKLSDPSFKAFLQSGPQGIVRIMTDGIFNDEPHSTLLVTINTTAEEVVHALWDKIEVASDERMFYLAQLQTEKANLVPEVELKGTDCPLLLQCRWPDIERYQFHLKKRPGGRIQVSVEELLIDVDIANFTTTDDVIQLILKRLRKGEAVEDYHLCFQDNEGYEPRMSPDLTLLSLPHEEGTTLAFRLLKNDLPGVRSAQCSPMPKSDSREVLELENRVATLTTELETLHGKLGAETQRADSEKMSSEAFHDRCQFLEEMVKVKEGEVEKLTEEAEELKLNVTKERQRLNEVNLEKKKLRTLFDELNEKAEELEDENEKLKCDSGHWKKIAVSQDRLMQDIEPLKSENERYKGRIKNLEAELSRQKEEAEATTKEDSSTVEDLKSQINVLHQSILDKDSKILELEFTLQRKEREVVDSKEAYDDQRRNADKASVALQDSDDRNKELLKKVEGYKRLVAERDKQIQMFKLTQGKVEESTREELSRIKLQIIERDTELDNLKKELQEVNVEYKERIESLQELVAEKDVAVRKTEMRLAKDTEDLKITADLLERKLGTKDQTIKKLEDKVTKLETMTRENLKKFEKFMSDKDRMMKQIKADGQRDVENLKSKLQKAEDTNLEKDKQIRELQRISNASKDRYELRLRPIEEENKQQKFLLEKLLDIVNTRDPRILKEFEESFDDVDSVDDKEPLIQKEDEWC